MKLDLAVADRAPGVAFAEPADMVEHVIANDCSALGEVPRGHVQPAGVLRAQIGMVDDVVFHHVVVAADQQGLVVAVVDQVVARPVADPGQVDARVVGALERGDVMDVVVVRVAIAPRQAAAVAGVDADTAGPGGVDIVAHGARVASAHNRHTPQPRVADGAAGDERAGAVPRA